jgi:hypothetical protein
MLKAVKKLSTIKKQNTATASSIFKHVPAWNWYINLTIDGTIYPSQHFPFGAAFVCQAGKFWTLPRSPNSGWSPETASRRVSIWTVAVYPDPMSPTSTSSTVKTPAFFVVLCCVNVFLLCIVSPLFLYCACSLFLYCATLTEGFPCFFLSCKANASV